MENLSSTAQLMSILSMDAYNRGYKPGINFSSDPAKGPQPLERDFEADSALESVKLVSLANFIDDENYKEWQKIEHFAQVYEVTDSSHGLAKGTIVISYRGTDEFKNTDTWTADTITGWFQGTGTAADQTRMAAEIYNAVSLKVGGSADIVLTGHSLGGGLAGFVAATQGAKAWIFDNMPFEGAARFALGQSEVQSKALPELHEQLLHLIDNVDLLGEKAKEHEQPTLRDKVETMIQRLDQTVDQAINNQGRKSYYISEKQKLDLDNIHAYAVKGEVLQYVREDVGRIVEKLTDVRAGLNSDASYSSLYDALQALTKDPLLEKAITDFGLFAKIGEGLGNLLFHPLVVELIDAATPIDEIIPIIAKTLCPDTYEAGEEYLGKWIDVVKTALDASITIATDVAVQEKKVDYFGTEEVPIQNVVTAHGLSSLLWLDAMGKKGAPDGWDKDFGLKLYDTVSNNEIATAIGFDGKDVNGKSTSGGKMEKAIAYSVYDGIHLEKYGDAAGTALINSTSQLALLNEDQSLGVTVLDWALDLSVAYAGSLAHHGVNKEDLAPSLLQGPVSTTESGVDTFVMIEAAPLFERIGMSLGHIPHNDEDMSDLLLSNMSSAYELAQSQDDTKQWFDVLFEDGRQPVPADRIAYYVDGNLKISNVLDSADGISLFVGGEHGTDIKGSTGDDLVLAKNAVNHISTGDGDDVVLGGSDSDTINTGGGKAVVDAGAGNDRVFITDLRIAANGGKGIDTADFSDRDAGIFLKQENGHFSAQDFEGFLEHEPGPASNLMGFESYVGTGATDYFTFYGTNAHFDGGEGPGIDKFSYTGTQSVSVSISRMETDDVVSAALEVSNDALLDPLRWTATAINMESYVGSEANEDIKVSEFVDGLNVSALSGYDALDVSDISDLLLRSRGGLSGNEEWSGALCQGDEIMTFSGVNDLVIGNNIKLDIAYFNSAVDRVSGIELPSALSLLSSVSTTAIEAVTLWKDAVFEAVSEFSDDWIIPALQFSTDERTLEIVGGSLVEDMGDGDNTISFAGNEQAQNIIFSKGQVTGTTQDGENFVDARSVDHLVLSKYDDTVVVDGSSVSLDTGAGSDVIIAGGGSSDITTGAGNDTLYFQGAYTGHHKVSDIDVSSDKVDMGFAEYGGSLGAIVENDTSVRVGINEYGSEVGSVTFEGITYNDLVRLGVAPTRATEFDDYIVGTNGNDRIFALAGNDTVLAGAGDDRIYGQAGDDLLMGGLGNDVYYWNAGDGVDTYHDEGGDRDVLALRYNTGAVTMGSTLNTVENGLDHIDVSGGRYYGTYYAQLQGTADDDTWDISNLTFGGTGHIYGRAYMGDGNDTVKVSAALDRAYGGTGNDTMIGSDGSDRLFGQDGDDHLVGNDGNDFFAGGVGDDLLEGGLGNDTYYWNAGDGVDTYHDEGGDHDVLGLRFDTGAATMGSAFNTVENGLDHVDVGGGRYYGTYYAQLQGTAGDDTWDISNLTFGGSGHIYGRVYMGDGNDTVKVSAALDRAYGGTGNDTMIGSDGSDRLYGQAGDDLLMGGLGNDIYYWNPGDGVDTYSDEGGDRDVLALRYNTGAATMGATLNTVENGLDHIDVSGGRYYGTYYAQLQGTADDDTWDISNLTFGGTGHIYGRAYMGDGNDTVKVSAALDRAYGGTGNDTMIGSDGSDRLFGQDGDDHLVGNDGNDFFAGGVGDDLLEGGLGNDTYYWNAGDGVDTYHDEGGDHDVLGLRFDTGAATMGSAFNTVENGLDHVDVGGGRYYGTYYAQLQGTAGDDTWDISNLTFGGSGHIYGRVYMGDGNDTVKVSAALDRAYGGTGNDTMIGSDGSDRLYGQAGDDLLMGGLGNDIYYWNPGDGVDTYSDEGGDRDVLALRYNTGAVTMGATLNTVENGLDHIDVSGGRYYRTYYAQLQGTADDDTWDISNLTFGGTGHIYGRAYMGDGNDTVKVSAALDRAYGGTGNDTMIGSDGSDRLFGQDGDDHLVGNDGNDFFAGGVGDDLLEGGLGNDTYYWNAGDGVDTYHDEGGDHDVLGLRFDTGAATMGSAFNTVENGLDHVDVGGGRYYRTYYAQLQGTADDDTWDISNLTFGGTGHIYGRAYMGDGNDTVKVSAALDRAYGGTGNDTMIGSDGSDRLYGQAGDDLIFAGGGSDFVDGGAGFDTLILNDGFVFVPQEEEDDPWVFSNGVHQVTAIGFEAYGHSSGYDMIA